MKQRRGKKSTMIGIVKKEDTEMNCFEAVSYALSKLNLC